MQHSCSAIAEASAGGVSSVPGDKSIPNDGSDGVSNLGQNEKKTKSSLMDCDPKMKPIICYPIFVVMFCIFVERKNPKSSGHIPICFQLRNSRKTELWQPSTPHPGGNFGGSLAQSLPFMP